MTPQTGRATTVIELHVEAPGKPAPGQACNGCGWCCAWQPCPLGMLLSRRRSGRCRVLRWQPAERRYRCGALAEPARHLPWLPAGLSERLVHRWIGAGRGCDADIVEG